MDDVNDHAGDGDPAGAGPGAGVSRRRFLAIVGLGGAGAGVAALPGCSSASRSMADTSVLPTRRLASLSDGPATVTAAGRFLGDEVFCAISPQAFPLGQ